MAIFRMLMLSLGLPQGHLCLLLGIKPFGDETKTPFLPQHPLAERALAERVLRMYRELKRVHAKEINTNGGIRPGSGRKDTTFYVLELRRKAFTELLLQYRLVQQVMLEYPHLADYHRLSLHYLSCDLFEKILKNREVDQVLLAYLLRKGDPGVIN